MQRGHRLGEPVADAERLRRCLRAHHKLRLWPRRLLLLLRDWPAVRRRREWPSCERMCAMGRKLRMESRAHSARRWRTVHKLRGHRCVLHRRVLHLRVHADLLQLLDLLDPRLKLLHSRNGCQYSGRCSEKPTFPLPRHQHAFSFSSPFSFSNPFR